MGTHFFSYVQGNGWVRWSTWTVRSWWCIICMVLQLKDITSPHNKNTVCIVFGKNWKLGKLSVCSRCGGSKSDRQRLLLLLDVWTVAENLSVTHVLSVENYAGRIVRPRIVYPHIVRREDLQGFERRLLASLTSALECLDAFSWRRNAPKFDCVVVIDQFL
jgi:hypothetical protein